MTARDRERERKWMGLSHEEFAAWLVGGKDLLEEYWRSQRPGSRGDNAPATSGDVSEGNDEATGAGTSNQDMRDE